MTSVPVGARGGQPVDVGLGARRVDFATKFSSFRDMLQSLGGVRAHALLSERPADSENATRASPIVREEPFAALPSRPASPELGEPTVQSDSTELVLDDGRAPELDALEFVLSAPVLRSEAAVPATVRAASIEPWVQEIVKHIAWGGDRRRGAARIELGAGRFAGASVVVQADGNSVSLELAAPPGVEAAALGERLRERLEARGLVVRELSIR